MGEERLDWQRVANELTARGATTPCNRCGSKSFTIAKDFINLSMQPSLGSIIIGGASIPTAAVICTHCGAITLHALGVLGLLPQSDEHQQREVKKTEAPKKEGKC